MVSGHSVEENPIPQQSKKKVQEEQQASHKNKYTCTAHAEVAEARSPLTTLPMRVYAISA